MDESTYLTIQQELDAQKMALDTQTAEVKKTAHGQSSRSRIHKKTMGCSKLAPCIPVLIFFTFLA